MNDVKDGILIACIGNIFLGDDGFGFEVAQAFAGASLPPRVQLVDYGIRGLDLAYALLRPWRAVIIVDAIARGDAPGTLYLLRPADPLTNQAPSGLDPHAMDPMRVLATARSIGAAGADIYILGCEPQDFGETLEGRIGLSPPVAAAVPEAVIMVLELAEKLTSAASQCAA